MGESGEGRGTSGGYSLTTVREVGVGQSLSFGRSGCGGSTTGGSCEGSD